MASVTKRCAKCWKAGFVDERRRPRKTCAYCGGSEAFYQVRYRDPSGKQRGQQFDRKLDADRFGSTVESDKLRGAWVDPDLAKTTFGAYVKAWLPSTSHLAPNTRLNIDGRLRNHLLPYFGELPLGAIRPAHVRGWVAEMIGKGLAAGTVTAAYRTLGKIIRTAEIDGHIVRSPLLGIDLPKEVARAEMTFLTASEVAALAEAVEPRYRALIYTAAYTGLRFGELAALKVERVNLLRGTVHVTESLSEVNGKLHLKGTKNGKDRTVSLPRFLAQMLGEHIGRYPSREGHVFSSATGEPLRRRNWYGRHIRPVVDGRPELPAARGRAARPEVPSPLPEDKRRLRFHDLRHTYGTALEIRGVASGVPFGRWCDCWGAGDLGFGRGSGSREADASSMVRAASHTCVAFDVMMWQLVGMRLMP
jgi:integrase